MKNTSLLLLIAYLHSFYFCQKISEITLGNYKELTYDPNSSIPAIYYKYTITADDIKDGEDIGILVRPLDFKSDPDIFVSQKTATPSFEENDFE